MWQEMTARDRQIVREYLTLRVARKMIKNDINELKFVEQIKLSRLYSDLISEKLDYIERRIELLKMRYRMRVKSSEVATVYEAMVQNRKGDVEIEITEIMENIREMFFK